MSEAVLSELDRAHAIIRRQAGERTDLLAHIEALAIDNERLCKIEDAASKVIASLGPGFNANDKLLQELRLELGPQNDNRRLGRLAGIEAAARVVVKDATPERDAGEPTGFSLVFSYKIDALYHAFADDKRKCEMCEGGQVWTECCDGSKGCACRGMQVLFGQCRVCGGTGWHHKNADTQANIAAIRRHGEIFGGYLGNPHGQLRP